MEEYKTFHTDHIIHQLDSALREETEYVVMRQLLIHLLTTRYVITCDTVHSLLNIHIHTYLDRHTETIGNLIPMFDMPIFSIISKPATNEDNKGLFLC